MNVMNTINEIFELANDENFVKYVAKEISPKVMTAKEWKENKIFFILKCAKLAVECK